MALIISLFEQQALDPLGNLLTNRLPKSCYTVLVGGTHVGTEAAQLGHSLLTVDWTTDENYDVAGWTGAVDAAVGRDSVTGAGGRRQRRSNGETQVHVTSGRYLNRPNTRVCRRHSARVVGTGKRSVHLLQLTATT